MTSGTDDAPATLNASEAADVQRLESAETRASKAGSEGGAPTRSPPQPTACTQTKPASSTRHAAQAKRARTKTTRSTLKTAC